MHNFSVRPLYNRKYKIQMRGARTPEEKEYDNIKALIRARESRKNRTKKSMTKTRVKLRRE